MPSGEELNEDTERMVQAADALTRRLLRILRTAFRIEILPGEEAEVISYSVLFDAVRSAHEAYQDTRNTYPYAITVIKCHAIQAFWLAKLKPIKTGWLQREDGRYQIININESVAICFMLDAIFNGLRTGKIREFFGHGMPSTDYVEKFIEEYSATPAFFRRDGEPVPNSQLLRETAHHMRYKNLTAVALYEMMMHSLIPARIEMGRG